MHVEIVFLTYLRLIKTEKFLLLLINDGEKNRPPPGKLASSFYTIIYDISTDWQAMPLWALPISPKSVICLFEKHKIIIDKNNYRE